MDSAFSLDHGSYNGVLKGNLTSGRESFVEQNNDEEVGFGEDGVYVGVEERDVYCYSGGCLAAIVHLLKVDIETVLEIGTRLQKGIIDGDISRYAVVEVFTKEIIMGRDVSEVFERVVFMSTSLYDGLTVVSDKACTPEDLVSRVIETTWIPGITGLGLTTTEGMLDGFFSVFRHPKTTSEIPGLPWDLRGLSPGLSPENAKTTYWEGREEGKMGFIRLD
ncbi:hypothetical protein TrCOL_g5684 [Triparma columacea]|uniref:Uncharacterized protein n=1 Tax=Triparma columacea TaxID=722753 RepID=A0A9W7GN36_9STRA|nr:hypothetical protein TrCOL_g5684 [Triparma columacea]